MQHYPISVVREEICKAGLKKRHGIYDLVTRKVKKVGNRYWLNCADPLNSNRLKRASKLGGNLHPVFASAWRKFR